jgi:hypothetical protein
MAAIATGLIWGVFHYPVILVGFQSYENAFLGLLIFPLASYAGVLAWLPLGVVCAWIVVTGQLCPVREPSRLNLPVSGEEEKDA